MADGFSARMRHLEEQVGFGLLTAADVVDQVYAKAQELRDDYVHPHGGQAHALRDSLFEQAQDIRSAWAEGLVTATGSDVRGAGTRVAELIAQGYYDRAPFEFGDLKASPHPTAEDNGAVYYDRAPMVHRLTRDELRAKGDLRRLGLGNARDDAHLEDLLYGGGA